MDRTLIIAMAGKARGPRAANDNPQGTPPRSSRAERGSPVGQKLAGEAGNGAARESLPSPAHSDGAATSTRSTSLTSEQRAEIRAVTDAFDAELARFDRALAGLKSIFS